MANVVVYARYSSDKQTEQSIEGQIRVCKEYAERNNLNIIDYYIDRAISGTIDNRPDFQRMIRDSKKKQFEYVLVYKLDRFARSRRDSANYKFKLRTNGVKVISAMEQIGDNPESIILEAVLEAQAEYYSLDLAQKVKRGMHESIYKKQFIGGTIPYGYKVENLKIYVNKKEAEVLKYVFTSYADGVPKKEIIRELNSKGIKNRKGNNFTSNSFQSVLQNRKYIGEYIFENEIINDYYPTIIDKITFEKVQKRLKRNKRIAASSKANIKFLLTGKAFCGHCGNTMVGTSSTSRNGNTHYYYACSTQYKKHQCNKKAEKKEFLEYYICEQTLKYVLNPEKAKLIAEKVVNEYNKLYNNDNIKELELKLSKIETEINKIVDSFIDAESQAIRKKLNVKIANLDLQASEIKNQIAKDKLSCINKLTTKEVISWIKIFTNGDINDGNFRERLIDTFINSIFIYDDKIVIYYNLNERDQLTHIEKKENEHATGRQTDACSNSIDNGSQHGVRTRECRLERAMC